MLIDFTDLFSPVSRISTILLLAALSVVYAIPLRSVDIANAFTTAKMDTETYVSDPPPNNQPGMYRRLLQALYGCKQSPRLWWKLLISIILDFGFVQFQKEPCLFRYVDTEDATQFIILDTYVDDMTDLSSTVTIRQRWLDFLASKLPDGAVKDLGETSEVISIEVAYKFEGTKRSVHLNQKRFAETLLARHNVTEPARSSPAGKQLYTLEPSTDPDPILTHEYQQIVGGLLYLSNATWPSLAHTVGRLCRYMHAPTVACMEAARDALRFVKSDSASGIEYSTSADPVTPNFDTMKTGSPLIVTHLVLSGVFLRT